MATLIEEWTDITVAVAAVAALIVSLASLKYSWRALRLSEPREHRRAPMLALKLLNSFFERIPQRSRVYCCQSALQP